MKKLKEIRLIFENCESAAVPIKDIHGFGIGEITQHYYSCNIDEGSGGQSATYFWMNFKDLKNQKYKGWPDEKKDKSLLDRLRYGDVTHIDIVYKDKTNVYIGVPWGSRSQFYNAFQIIRKGKYGYLLEIDKGWTIRKIFKYMIRLLRQAKWRIKKYIKGNKI